jgi:hypothetical protein
MNEKELLEYYEKEHFKLHFELNHYVHYQEYNGQWLRAKWQNIVTNPRGIKRIQYNTSNFKRYIIVDIDNDNLFDFEKLDIPKPNFIVKNKDKVGGHLFWVLDKVFTSEYYIKLWRDIQKYFSTVLDGDAQNVGSIGKNPYNSLDFEYIEIYPFYYTIKDLHGFVVPEEKQVQNELPYFESYKTINTKEKVVSSGRNVDLFNTSRVFAYQLIKEDIDTINFKFRLLNKIKEENNNFSCPLKSKEILDIYKSILKYCLKNWSAIKHNRKEKKVKIEENMSNKEKLQLGAKYTHNTRKNKTQLEIEKALIEMREKDIKINVSSVAKYTKKTRITINNYKFLFC